MVARFGYFAGVLTMTFSPPSQRNTQGHILAGGRATRMQGEDKGLLELNDRPLVAYVIERLRPQVSNICISANRHLSQYQHYGLPVITDSLAGFLGPLAGIHTALLACEKEWLLTVPVDCPFLPEDLLHRLSKAVTTAQRPLAVVHDGTGLQPAFCLLHHGLGDDLQSYLEQGGRKTAEWLRQHNPALADYSDHPDVFLNINSPADLELAGRRLAHVD